MLAARSRFLVPILLLAFVGVPAYAAGLIDINTADDAALETLPGIGPTKATAVVAYRTEHGPFARTQDIENVSGIGPATYANIASLITVGAPAVSALSSPAASSSVSAPDSGAAQTYVPPPSDLRVTVSANPQALRNVPATFSARVRTSTGALDPGARIQWSFGDGSTGEGSPTFKTYRYPGSYVVEVRATDGDASASDTLVVAVASAQVRIMGESSTGITIANDSSERLDLSGWRLWAGSGTFRVPPGTSILPKTSVLFPTSVTNLPIAFDARLYYPDGLLASQYQPSAPVSATSTAPVANVQPQPASTRFSTVQRADSAAISTLSNRGTAHAAQAVSAPAVATTVAAAGASLSEASSGAPAAVAASHTGTGLFSSPWTYGLFGVVAAAAGVLVLL